MILPWAGRGYAGWYEDPTKMYDLRYFNGERWCADVSSAGITSWNSLFLEDLNGAD